MTNKSASDRIWVSLTLLLVGAIVGGIVEEVLDYRRELRENTQSFVETFNSTYFGNHRDRLHNFFMQPETIAATSGSLTRMEYSEWLNTWVRGDESLSAAIFAIAEFYRTVDNCMSEGRCSTKSVQNAFSPYARIYYDLFYLALRHADCELGFPDTELATARIAKLPSTQASLCGSELPIPQ